MVRRDLAASKKDRMKARGGKKAKKAKAPPKTLVEATPTYAGRRPGCVFATEKG
eukprot:CAMPEP_0119286226 /NCGR_PEP_ID=MMETSP1329-20130426/33508_1 /TAXON_ID=114041 /ORGANISM="Genus nov. species nov., Strain RCC1024" /LENGTH=53 /DNA_ID=CAMNT_0007286955 /DNA_START=133 /DNA_END=290 /DNA_ORIENTATION=-